MATKNKRQAAQDAGDETTYEVLSRLQHDGETYAPGDTVVLDAVAAEPLVKINVVRAVAKE